VLLAMLMPLRGVTASGLLCDQRSDPHADTLAAHDHAMIGADAQDQAQHDHDHVDKGRHCLGSCSATPLISAPLTLAMPVVAGSTVFPHFAALASTFQSGGQERPPRSI